MTSWQHSLMPISSTMLAKCWKRSSLSPPAKKAALRCKCRMKLVIRRRLPNGPSLWQNWQSRLLTERDSLKQHHNKRHSMECANAHATCRPQCPPKVTACCHAPTGENEQHTVLWHHAPAPGNRSLIVCKTLLQSRKRKCSYRSNGCADSWTMVSTRPCSCLNSF